MADFIEDESEATEERPARRRSGSFIGNLLWIIIGVFATAAIVLLTIFIWDSLPKGGPTKIEPMDAVAPSDAISPDLRGYSLGEIEQQLLPSAGETTPGRVTVDVALMYPESLGELDEDFSSHDAEIRNAVGNTLARFRADQLLAPDGRDIAKEEIRAALNRFLDMDDGSGVIYEVTLTNMSVLRGTS